MQYVLYVTCLVCFCLFFVIRAQSRFIEVPNNQCSKMKVAYLLLFVLNRYAICT